MNANEYQTQSARTGGAAAGFTYRDQLSNAALGIAGESGEVVELVKKGLHHGRGICADDVAAELGDLLWYVAELCTVCGLDMGDVMEANVAKLRARYPDGFVKGGGVREGEQ